MKVSKRNPQAVCDALRTLLQKEPHLRVGQVIQNVVQGYYGLNDPFYIEDEDLAGLLHLWATLGSEMWEEARGGAAKALLLDQAKKDLGL